MANIKPLGQRVLVKRIEAETKTAGGLFLPDTAKEKPQEAEVISVGTGGRDEKGALIEFYREARRPRAYFQVRRHGNQTGRGRLPYPV